MQENDSFFLEFFKKVLPYSWLILIFTLIGFVGSWIYVNFTPSIYEAQAIIKVKTDNNRREVGELNPLEEIYSSNSENIDQDLALLQTFHIHKKAIEKLNLKVQYYREDGFHGYKKSELLSNIPIEISDITILDKNITDRYIKIVDGESRFIIDKKPYRKLFNYNKEVVTPWFKFKVSKKSDFNGTLYIKLNGDSRKIYEKIIKQNFNAIRLNRNTSLIKITFQNNSPQRAVLYLNNLIDIYIKESIINKSKQNNRILNFINRQLKKTGKALKNSEIELENFRIKNSVIEPTRQSQSLLDRLSNIEVQLSQIDIEKRLINTLSYNIRDNRDLSSITPTLQELGDEPTIRIIQNLQELERRANELSREYTDKYPALKAIRRDIRRNNQIIIRNIRQLKKNISQREKKLLELKRKYEKELKILPTKEKKLVDLQRNHEVNAKMYSYLLEKQAENNIKRVATASDYEIIDSAYSNEIPIKPKKFMLISITTIFTLILGLLIAYWHSSSVDRLQSVKEIEELTDLPLYIELPILKKSKYLTRDSSQLLSSYRNFRTKINFSHPKSKGNVVLITSSPQREAKINVVSNLAFVFQKAEYKTLIIDFDIYNPKIHKDYIENIGVGVTDYLNGKESNIDKLIQKTKYENLDIITAGSMRDDISELLLSKRLYFLIETVKKRYNFIFINAIPLTIEADVLYIMKYSDLNLITVQEGYTKKSFIRDIKKKIGEYDFKNVAIVAITKWEKS